MPKSWGPLGPNKPNTKPVCLKQPVNGKGYDGLLHE